MPLCNPYSSLAQDLGMDLHLWKLIWKTRNAPFGPPRRTLHPTREVPVSLLSRPWEKANWPRKGPIWPWGPLRGNRGLRAQGPGGPRGAQEGPGGLGRAQEDPGSVPQGPQGSPGPLGALGGPVPELEFRVLVGPGQHFPFGAQWSLLGLSLIHISEPTRPY